MFIILLINLVLILGIVFCFIMAVKSGKKSKEQSSLMSESQTFQEIISIIFTEYRPSRICITLNNEIFYGPIQSSYRQVPSNLIPPMDHLQRYSLGEALASQCGYQSNTCFGPQGQNLGLCRTGNNYLDMNTDIFIEGNVGTGSWK